MNLNNYNIDAYIKEWKNIIISESERYDYPTDDEMDDMYEQSKKFAKDAKAKLPHELENMFVDNNYVCLGTSYDETQSPVIIDSDKSFRNLNDTMV